VCCAPRSELATALELSAQHARSLLDAHERHAAHAGAAETLHSQIRALELQLAELPSAEEVRALEAEAASRLGAALARAAELEVQLSRVEETVVSETVERLTASMRALEIQLAEQASEADVAALQDKLRSAEARAAELEAAGAAAARAADVRRLEEARAAPPAPPAPTSLAVATPAALTAAAAQPAAAVPAALPTRTVVYPDGIQQQLRRIEELLVSLPAPQLGAAAAAAPVRHARMRGCFHALHVAPANYRARAQAAPTRSAPEASAQQAPPPARPAEFTLRRRQFTPSRPGPPGAEVAGATAGFVRAPAGRFALRRHIFRAE
jgi:hypothetical protein